MNDKKEKQTNKEEQVILRNCVWEWLLLPWESILPAVWGWRANHGRFPADAEQWKAAGGEGQQNNLSPKYYLSIHAPLQVSHSFSIDSVSLLGCEHTLWATYAGVSQLLCLNQNIH